MMNMQSAARGIFGAGLILAMTAAAMPALAGTVTVVNGGPATLSSSGFSFLRYRNGVVGESNLNISFTCIATVGSTVTGGTNIPVPATLIAITSKNPFSAGFSQCSSFTLKDSSTGGYISATDPLPITFTSATAGYLSNVEISQPMWGNCTSAPGRTIAVTWTNATATSAAVLTLKGPFYIGQALALGDPVDNYCYSAIDVPLTVSSPATFSSQPSITSP